MKTAVEFARDAGIIAFGDIWLEPKTIKRLIELVRADEREACAKICDEMRKYWSDYKNTALLNGNIELSNAASGEPRAAEFLAESIRARDQQ